MARITSKQAKEMNEAYAKVHQNLAEETARERMQRNKERITNPFGNVTIEKEDGTKLKQGDKGFDQALDKGRDAVTKANNKSLEGRGGNSNNNTSNNNNQQSNNNNQSPSGGQQPQSGVNRSQTVVRDGNRTTTTTRTSADSSTPEGAAAVKDFKANRAERLNRLRSGGGLRPDGQGPSTGGTPPSTQSGGQPPAQGAKKPGLLGRLGSLAGKAVGSARNTATAAASNVKQGAQAAANTARNAASGIKQAATSAASNIKKGAEAVAGGAKRVAGGVADAATGNMTDFDKRGGKPQGVARVVAGGIDKLTGDRTDLDKRGPSKPAQQQEKPAPQQEKPAPQQEKPAKKMSSIEKKNRAIHGDDKIDALKSKNAEFQAAKKSGNMKQYRKDNPKLSGAERAKAMARERIAAKKAAATPVNASYDFFDDTVQFLVSEGHAKDKSEAMSIMSESEFIDAFNQELNG